MSFSKGPWTSEIEPAKCWSTITSPDGQVGLVDPQFPNRFDNANLIAAAPELYEAAAMLEDLMTNHSENFRVEAKELPTDLVATAMFEKFILALKKARGES